MIGTTKETDVLRVLLVEHTIVTKILKMFIYIHYEKNGEKRKLISCVSLRLENNFRIISAGTDVLSLYCFFKKVLICFATASYLL